MDERPSKRVLVGDLRLEIDTEGGTLPIQIEGRITYVDTVSQETVTLAFYSRERDGWSLEIAPPGMTVRQVWEENRERRARGEPEVGYIHPDLDLEDMYLLIARHAQRYRKELAQERTQE